MPKEGYESITIPEYLGEKISKFVTESQGLVANKTQAFYQAWQIYETIYLEKKNLKPVRIGSRLVGHNQPTFIVAEIGINHNGDIELCKKLIDMAVENGCDAVKFQKRTIEKVYSKEDLDKPRESPWGTTNREQKMGLEFGEAEFKEIDRYCKQKNIIWFASAWDLDSVDFLEKFNIPCHKVASAMLTDKKFLLKLKSTGKPIILSTGMSTMNQIKKAMQLLGEENIILLHCTSTYPTDWSELNLNMIKTLRKYFNCPIGYSGHESIVYPSVLAVSLGACVIERHITLDRTMYGSDQAASLEKKGLELMCKEIRSVPKFLGDGVKKVYASEVPIIKKLRAVDTL